MKRPIYILAFFALILAVAPQIHAGPPSRLDLGEDFTFAVISDNRSGDRVYAKIVGELVRRSPAFVIHTGDIMPTIGNLKQWQSFQKLSAPIKVPLYIVPGNHDIEDEKDKQIWKSWVEFPGEETYYSITVGKNLFVLLNSNEPDSIRRISGRQLVWLKKTLDPAKYEHQFVFLHHPLFMWKDAFHENEGLDRYPNERDDLHRLFVEKKVDMVFSGHEHTYRRMDKDGVRYVVAGGAGSPLYSGFHNFSLVHVDGPSIEVKVIDKEGVLKDEYTLGPILQKK